MGFTNNKNFYTAIPAPPSGAFGTTPYINYRKFRHMLNTRRGLLACLTGRKLLKDDGKQHLI